MKGELAASFLAVASNFDAVAVLCSKEGCHGHLERWPVKYRSRVHVFDAATIDAELKKTVQIPSHNSVRAHFFKVTMSHVYVADKFDRNVLNA